MVAGALSGAGRPLRAILIASLLLLTLGTPPAAATNTCQSAGVAYTCAGEFDTSCASWTGGYANVGSGAPVASVLVQGVHYECCCYGGSAVVVSASAAGNTVTLRRFSSVWGCAHELYVNALGVRDEVAFPCVVGVPNPNWGHLLP